MQDILEGSRILSEVLSKKIFFTSLSSFDRPVLVKCENMINLVLIDNGR